MSVLQAKYCIEIEYFTFDMHAYVCTVHVGLTYTRSNISMHRVHMSTVPCRKPKKYRSTFKIWVACRMYCTVVCSFFFFPNHIHTIIHICCTHCTVQCNMYVSSYNICMILVPLLDIMSSWLLCIIVFTVGSGGGAYCVSVKTTCSFIIGNPKNETYQITSHAKNC